MDVQIFTTDTCSACAAAKAFFKTKGVRFRERNVQHDEIALREMIEKSNSYAVPVIEIDGQVIIGFNRQKVAELLEA